MVSGTFGCTAGLGGSSLIGLVGIGLTGFLPLTLSAQLGPASDTGTGLLVRSRLRLGLELNFRLGHACYPARVKTRDA